MSCRPRTIVTRMGALALVACLRGLCPSAGVAQHVATTGAISLDPVVPSALEIGYDNGTVTPAVGVEGGAAHRAAIPAQYCEPVPVVPMAQPWIAPAPVVAAPYVDADVHVAEPGWGSPIVSETCPMPGEAWHWQALPDGLIYHSYWAGAHEPRLAILAFHEEGSQSFWDGALGGRVGLLRYGTSNAIFPQGWQLDVEAAAIIRMTLDEIRDFEFADYRVGIPVTYGIDNWQFKFAVYHLSSHLGDEFAIANPGSLADRINYVRDAIVLGASYYPIPIMRLYSEAAYAVNVDGGAEPWEFQFGTELSQPGPTGLSGTPFFAINGHLREEHEFGGDVSTQAGWLWRGESGQVVRAGVHYFNGKSSQYQIFDNSEQQIGFGLWYDF